MIPELQSIGIVTMKNLPLLRQFRRQDASSDVASFKQTRRSNRGSPLLVKNQTSPGDVRGRSAGYQMGHHSPAWPLTELAHELPVAW